jgi:hypothetical protein
VGFLATSQNQGLLHMTYVSKSALPNVNSSIANRKIDTAKTLI